jgi:hypothetical protein
MVAAAAVVLSGCPGAVNAQNEKVNTVVNVLTGEEDAVPATARYYKSKGLPWVVIGEPYAPLVGWFGCRLG